jgi:hypothetical protein
MAAFTVFIYRAPWVQAELLYYTLSFLTFLMLLELILRPRLWLAVLAGLTAAAAHLTKAALLPGLALVLAVMLVLAVWRLIGRREARALVCTALVAVAFLAAVYPYISTSKKLFGRWFYNVNTTFYMWYDTHEQVMTGTRVHGDRQGWPDLPPQEIPSMFLLWAAFALFALVLSEFGAIAAASRGPRPARSWKGENVAAVVFGGGWIAGYLILVAWVSATNPGITRLSLQVFLPLMFALIWLASRGDAVAQRLGIAGRRISLSGIFCLVALAVLCVDGYFSFAHRLSTHFSGD